MSYHVFYNSEDEYLSHSLKGLARKFHKYLLRIKVGNKYRYFYSKAEIDAYMKKLKDKLGRDKLFRDPDEPKENKSSALKDFANEVQKELDVGIGSKLFRDPDEPKENKSSALKKFADEVQKELDVGLGSKVFEYNDIDWSKGPEYAFQQRDKKRNQEVAQKVVAASKKKLNEIATEREHEVAFKNYAYIGNVQSAIQSKARTYSAPTRTKVSDETKARANVVAKAQKQMDELQKKIKDGSISSGMAALSARAIQDEMEFSLDHIDHEVKQNNGVNLKEYLK